MDGLPSLQISLMGDFRLIYEDQILSTVNTPRLKSLLAYLLLHREAPQSRQHLAFIFWPDTTEEQARANLRNLIFQLRRALPDSGNYLLIETQTIQWNPQASFTLDVEAFTRLVNRAALGDSLRQAIDLYRGDLLPECYDDWIQPERERLRLAYIDALHRLIQQLENGRNYTAAVSYAQRLLQADPLLEDTYLQLMRLYAAAGERARALHVFHTCASLFERELGVEPGPELQAIYQRLLEAKDVTVFKSAGHPLALIGRQTEWGLIQSAWRAASRGQVQCVLLKGEAGIGKTRLVEEMIDWAERQGIASSVSYCYSAEGSLAYAPVATWLRSRPLPKIEPLWLTEIARLLPELLVEHTEMSQPGPLSESWQRLRLFKGLAHAVLRDRPTVILVIEDLQWCDRDTLEWIAYLLQSQAEIAPHTRLLWIGTLRTEDTGSNQQVEYLLADLRRGAQLAEIELGPLDEAETLSLVRQVVGDAMDFAVGVSLYRETEGNPLFVVEMAQLMRERKLEGGNKPFAMPSKVQSVIQSRLGQLTPLARELAEVAAVIGRRFAYPILSQAAGGDEEKIVGGLDELWRRRIVREQSQDDYDFSHDKIREMVYQSLSTARRKLLHHHVAKALEVVYANELDTISGQMAAHYEQAGKIETAVHWYKRAAEGSRCIYSNQMAIDFYHRALALIESGHPDPGLAARLSELNSTLHEELGDVLALLRQLDEARDHYQAAQTVTVPGNPLLPARLHRKIGRISPEKEAAEIYSVCEEILASQVDNTSPAWWHEWIELKTDRISNYFRLGSASEVLALIPKLQPVVESKGTPTQRIHFFLSLAQKDDLTEPVFSDQGIDLLKAALIAAKETGNLTDVALVKFTIGALQTFRDEFADAERELQDALKLTEQTGDLLLKARCLCSLTILYRRRVLIEETRNCVSQALEASRAARSVYHIAISQANMAWVSWREGKLEQTRQLALTALAEPIFALEMMVWAALWPLVGVSIRQNQLSDAIEFSRRIFACKI